MKKKNSEEQCEKKTVQEMKAKVLESENEKERNRHYTKFVLARERVRAKEQKASEKEIKSEGNNEGNRTT